MANIPPVPPLTKLGFEDPVWVKWLNTLRQGVSTSVTALAINTANGFSGTVTPSGGGGSTVTLQVTASGILKGVAGQIRSAVAGVDYVASLAVNAPLTLSGGNTIGIPRSSGSVDGYLAATDFAAFNGKQPALGYTPLNAAANLSDLANIVTARANLSLGSMALQSSAAVAVTGGAIANVSISGTFSGASTWAGLQTYSTGIATVTLSATGTITPSTTAGIVGTTLGDNANTGSVGEYLESTVASGSAVSLVSGVIKDVTTLTLTAGDWDVWGNITLSPGATTVETVFQGGVSLVANTQATYPNHGCAFLVYCANATAFPFSSPTGVLRVNVAASQVVHLVVGATFTTSTNAAYGALCARRVR